MIDANGVVRVTMAGRKRIIMLAAVALIAAPAVAGPPQRKPVAKPPAPHRLAPRPAATPAPAPAPSPAAPAAPAGKGPEPIGEIASWFPEDSYPPAARAAGQAGRTAFSLDIDPMGRVTGCNIIETSGSELLDSTTCSQAILNGRFKPARDTSGRAVPGRWVSAMRWQLAEGRSDE